MRTDKELIDGLIAATMNGACPAVIFDDNGHWAVSTDGVQSVNAGSEANDTSTSFWIEAGKWRDSIREAINAWLDERAQALSADELQQIESLTADDRLQILQQVSCVSAVGSQATAILVEAAPKQSRLHREWIQQCMRVGCYFCIRVFEPSTIERWTDDGQTACCPNCDTDAVVPITDTDLLTRMCERWFTTDSFRAALRAGENDENPD